MAGGRGGYNTFAEIDGAFPQYYKILGVAQNATRRDITKAYRVLGLTEHPDKKGGTPAANERFAQINQARDVLTDVEMRKDYDRQLYQAEQEAEKERRRAEAERERRRVEAERRRAQAQAQGQAQGQARSQAEAQADADAWAQARGAPPPQSSFGTGAPRHPLFETNNIDRWPFWKYGKPDLSRSGGGWGGITLLHKVYHQRAELWARCSSLCDLVGEVQHLIQNLDAVATMAVPKHRTLFPNMMVRDDHEQKFHVGIEILWEILNFSGSGYVVVKRSLETQPQRSPADAAAEIDRLTPAVAKIHQQMQNTQHALSVMGTHILCQTATATTLWTLIGLLCIEWDNLLELPDVIQARMAKIFRDGEYRSGWQPVGPFYPIESWKQSRKTKAEAGNTGKTGKTGKTSKTDKAGRKRSKGDRSNSDSSKGVHSNSDKSSGRSWPDI